MKRLLLIPCLFFAQIPFSQNITFTDLALKDYLINETCVDTNGNGGPTSTLDFNGDQEIQVSEAEAVTFLSVAPFPSTYAIRSVDDLQYFKNLKILEISYVDSLIRIDNLGVGLDSLKQIFIQGGNLKHVDLSNLPVMEFINFSMVYALDYLNLRNGSTPAQGGLLLWYTDDIGFACVDSIASEYQEVAPHMRVGRTPSYNCFLAAPVPASIPLLDVFPNPTNGLIHLKSEIPMDHISIFGVDGKLLREINSPETEVQIDLSTFPSGIYSVIGYAGDEVFLRRVLRE